jgi:hypothetical protein
MEQEVMTLCEELSWYFTGLTEGDLEMPELAVTRPRIEMSRSPKQIRNLNSERDFSA